MLLLLLVLLASFAESVYLPQNILGHGSMKVQIKLEAAFFPHPLTYYCPHEANSADHFITWGYNCQHTCGSRWGHNNPDASQPIFQGILDFHLPKCFGVYSQNSKNCKFPCIVFINSLEKKKKKIPLSNISIKKSPTRTDHCPFSAAVCLQKL